MESSKTTRNARNPDDGTQRSRDIFMGEMELRGCKQSEASGSMETCAERGEISDTVELVPAGVADEVTRRMMGCA